MVRGNETRQKLIDAATQLVWEQSYGAVGVEEICEKAGVKKGSFYHFFDSKADLVSEALKADWQCNRQKLDEVFSPSIPALERLKRYVEMSYQKQCGFKKECGQVWGCFVTSIGCEVSKNEPLIGKTVCDLISQHCKYIESAIRDGVAEGVIPEQDVKAKARIIFGVTEGLMTQARIVNDPDVMRALPATIMALIGAKAEMAALIKVAYPVK